MPGVFYEFEESLKNFLSEEQSDNYNTCKTNFYKYNNLRIYMDPQKNPDPHFIIRIGISEVMYNLSDGEKISGSLGADDRIAKRWIERHLFKLNECNFWRNVKKIKPATPIEEYEEYIAS